MGRNICRELAPASKRLLPVGKIATFLPDLLDGLDITYFDALREAAYNSPAAKSDPYLRKLVERAGWSGDPRKESPSASDLLLHVICQDLNRLFSAGGNGAAIVATM
jgi:hypothetical protein